MRVADVQAADSTGEVDERVAVHVGEARAFAALDHNWEGEGQRISDDALFALDDLAGAGPGYVGSDVDRLRRRHEADDSAATGPVHTE